MALHLLLAAVLAQTVPTPARIAELATQSLNTLQTPGAAIAIVRGNQILYLQGHGLREQGKPDPITPESIFQIASTTKAFATTALAMLADEGRLHWDDPVRKHLPSFQLSDPFASENAALRDIVSHRTGLARHDALWARTPLSRAEVVRRIGHVKLTKPFRSEYQYQNIMFIAAGELIGAVTNSTWDHFLRTRIFLPLDMRNASTSHATATATADRAIPHRLLDNRPTPGQWINYDNVGAAGGINASVRDLAYWVRFQLTGGLDPSGRRLISSAALAETHAPHTVIRMTERERLLNPDTTQRTYALGWFIQHYKGQMLVAHSGVLEGFRALVTLHPASNTGIVVLANRNGTNVPEAITNNLLDEMLNLHHRDWDAHYATLAARFERQDRERIEKRDAQRLRDTAPSLPLIAFAGAFNHPAYGAARIRLEDGRLHLAWMNRLHALEHFQHDTFTTRQGPFENELINFHHGPDGSIAGFTVQEVTFQRADPAVSHDNLTRRIAAAIKLQPGEHVLIPYEPGNFHPTAALLESHAQSIGARPERVDISKPFAPSLATATAYIWLPVQEDGRQMLPENAAALTAWLDKGGANREVHFHWQQGGVYADGLFGEHFPALDTLYEKALDTPAPALAASQDKAIALLASGPVRVTTPDGTDITFEVRGRPFTRQDGDASPERMKQARVRIDREVELPAGAVRVAPLESTANGVIVIPEARFGSVTATGIRMEFRNGVVTALSAAANLAAVEAALAQGGPAARRFREFGLGFHPLLARPAGRVLPYFAYGAGMVRLSLGDNEELGGAVRGGFCRWFFFPNATVEAGGRKLVESGRLANHLEVNP